jgi:hypothetical protein
MRALLRTVISPELQPQQFAPGIPRNALGPRECLMGSGLSAKLGRRLAPAKRREAAGVFARSGGGSFSGRMCRVLNG